MQIALVRACATPWDDQNRLTGLQDVPLGERGKIAALHLARQLDFYPFAVLISAPCQAAQETSEILAEELGLRIRVDRSLTNVDLGLWEGRQIEELENYQPKMLKNWQESPDLVAPPEGETTDAVRARIRKSLKRWARKYEGQRILLVAPEPLASVIKSEWEQDPRFVLKQVTERSGTWEWLEQPANPPNVVS